MPEGRYREKEPNDVTFVIRQKRYNCAKDQRSNKRLLFYIDIKRFGLFEHPNKKIR